MFVIDDIIWLDTIVEKLAWKHRVFTSEVERCSQANAEYIGKRRVTWMENTYITH